MQISIADPADAPDLANLINSAYRGEASKKGWTSEADLFEGSIRIDLVGIEELLNSSDAVILKYSHVNQNAAGCVYLQRQSDIMYLGLLAVAPSLQAKGIGKQLLDAALDYALGWNCKAVQMNVISIRHELIAWYERHGFLRTGESRPFPNKNRFGAPKEDLDFVVLQKAI